MTEPSSRKIGRDLDDLVESLLRDWEGSLYTQHKVTTTFDSIVELDFRLPSTNARWATVIRYKNFAVAAKSKPNAQRRKAQEALYQAMQAQRHCKKTEGTRIILITGHKQFREKHVAFLNAELQPAFHIVSVLDEEQLRTLILH